LKPLLESLAAHLSEQFAAERDLDQMTDQLSHSYEEINLLYRFSHVLRPDEDFAATARKLLEETADLLEQRLLVLCQPEADRLEWRAGSGCAFPDLLDWLAVSRSALNAIHDEITRRWTDGDVANAFRHTGTVSSPGTQIHYIVSPVRVRSRVTGYVGFFRPDDEAPPETGELRLLECLAEELSTAATTRNLYQELREMLFSTVRSLVAAIDAKDEYTRGHSERVYQISSLIGQDLGLPPDDMQALTWASLLHDIGKIAIQGNILNKPGKLTVEEFNEVKSHPVRGCRVLEPIPQLQTSLPGIRHHHERHDGSGYPDGLRGDAIPLIARIISVADAFDAMFSSRSYRKAQTQEWAIEEIRTCAGTQFDPHVVESFLRLVERGALEQYRTLSADRPAA
jgi:hypothetical protein